MTKAQRRILKIMTGLLVTVILFHVLILTQVIPYTIVWAGKLKSVQEMLLFEIVSILINGFLILVLLLKGDYIKNSISVKLLNGIIWFFVFVFLLNTLGNLTSKTLLEKTVFTALTLVSSILLWLIVRPKKIKKSIKS